MKHGFSFVWVAGKHPCFISPGGTYIIVLNVDDVLPIWSPEHDKSGEFVGAFEFKLNLFRERCGIYIKSLGQPVIDCAVPGFYHASLQDDSAATVEHEDVEVEPRCSYSGSPKCIEVMAPVIKPTAIEKSHRPPPLVHPPILTSGNSVEAEDNIKMSSPRDVYGDDEEDPNFLPDEWTTYDVNGQPNDAPVGDVQYCPYTDSGRLQRTKLDDGSWCYDVQLITDDGDLMFPEATISEISENGAARFPC